MTTPQAPTRELGYATGGSGWWALGVDQTEGTPELQWPQSVLVYDRMRREDAQVRSVLRAVTLPVRRTAWRVDPAGARDEVVARVADDLGLPIVGVDQPSAPRRRRGRFSWSQHLAEALLMLPMGHMFFEQQYRIEESGGRQWARLRKLGPRMPRTLTAINVATDGGLESVEQEPLPGDDPRKKRTIPVRNLVAYVNDREGGDWKGQSVLRSCYKHWLIKDRLIRVQAQTIDRNGMGIPYYEGAEGETNLDKGLAMAKAYRSGDNSGAAGPHGAKLRLLGVEGALPDADPAIRYHDEQIARSVLAHVLNLGTHTGSWALGTTFADLLTQSLQTVADAVMDTGNLHIIEDIVDLNWGEDEPAPLLVCDEIGSRRDATADAIKMLIDAGAVWPDPKLEDFIRTAYGLPPQAPRNPIPAGDEQ